MFRPSEATLSRSITSSTSGWSILVSMIGGKANMPLVAAFCCNCCGELQDHLRLGGGGDDELDRELAAAGQRRRAWPTMVRMPGMRLTFCCTSGTIWNTVRLRSPQGLSTRPPKPLSGKVIWKRLRRLRHAHQLAVDRLGVKRGLVDRRIRRRLDDAQDDALVFRRRQFLGRHHEHRNRQQAQRDPDDVNRRARGQRGVQHPAVEPAQPVEVAVDPARSGRAPRARRRAAWRTSPARASAPRCRR